MTAWSRHYGGLQRSEQLLMLKPCFRTESRCYSVPGIKQREIAVNKKLTSWGMGVAAASASLAFLVSTASAQLAPTTPAPATAAPKAAAPAAAPAAKAATPAAGAPAAPAAKAAAAPAVAKPAKPATAKSVCNALADETACNANTACDYVKPVKADPKTGKVDKSYCRTKPIAKKAVEKTKAAAATGAAAVKTGAAAAVKAVTPAAPATAAAPAAGAAPAVKKP
jgi:hypothetical protein